MHKAVTPPHLGTLILLDATDQAELFAAVRGLRQRGWHCIVVVAAFPSWRAAQRMLGKAGAHDYWPKSYARDDIRRKVERCMKTLLRAQSPSLEDGGNAQADDLDSR